MTDNFIKTMLIISNQYNQLCELYECYHSEQEKIIDLDLAKNIIDKTISNAKIQQEIPEIYLIGADNSNVWNLITKDIINYILNKKEYIKITIYLEDTHIFDEHMFLFLIENKINIIYYISQLNNINKNILNINSSFLKIMFLITLNNINNIYNNYLYCVQNKIKNFKFLFNDKQFSIQNENLKLYETIEQEFDKIKNYIIKEFKNNKIPVIPENFLYQFIKILIIDNEKQKNVRMLNNIDLINYHCDILQEKRIFINQYGELFLCSSEPLNNKNKFYYGTITNIKNSNDFLAEIFNYNINYFKNIPHKLDNKSCQNKCNLFSVCSMGCFSNNLLNKNNSKININEPFQSYCKINQILYNKIKEIIILLDTEKNELFKDYFYTVITTKGLIGI